MKTIFNSIAVLALSITLPVNANVNPKIAEFCLKAQDFQGCVKSMSTDKDNCYEKATGIHAYRHVEESEAWGLNTTISVIDGSVQVHRLSGIAGDKECSTLYSVPINKPRVFSRECKEKFRVAQKDWIIAREFICQSVVARTDLYIKMR